MLRGGAGLIVSEVQLVRSEVCGRIRNGHFEDR